MANGEGDSPDIPPEDRNRPSDVEIRDYTPADEEKLVALYNTLSSTEEGEAALESRFESVVSLEEFKTFIKNPTVKHTSIALSPDGKDIVGIGQYMVSVDTPEIAELALLISPSFQRRGIGQSLIKYAIEICKSQNPDIKKMVAIAFASNEPSIGSLRKASQALGGTLEIIPDETNPHLTEYKFAFSLKDDPAGPPKNNTPSG